MEQTKEETLKITRDNYKGYVELYQTKKLENKANKEYFKGVKYLILTFLTLIPILIIDNSLMLKLLFFFNFAFFAGGVEKIIEAGNKLNKVEIFKKQNNNIDYETPLKEIEKAFEQFCRLRYFLKIEDLELPKKSIDKKIEELKSYQVENNNIKQKDKVKVKKIKKG